MSEIVWRFVKFHMLQSDENLLQVGASIKVTFWFDLTFNFEPVACVVVYRAMALLIVPPYNSRLTICIYLRGYL